MPPDSAQILPTHTSKLFTAAVHQAAMLLRAGEVVALPTETVYGLAANAFNAQAVERIFEIKGRPAYNPIIIHVSSGELAMRSVETWPAVAEKLASAFWPGPLTLVLKRSQEIPDIVTAGGCTVGVRWPSHPFMQAVIRECGFPLAAPSANPSNLVSPTNAEHVRKYLGRRIRLIVDGGQSQIGIESTVLDLSVAPPRLLRPGMIREEALLAVVGELRQGSTKSAQAIKSPGQLRRHYAPQAPLVVLSWQNEQDLRTQLSILPVASGKERPPTIHVIAHTHIPSHQGFGRVSVIPHDPEAFGRALYSELHQGDETGAELIVVEAPPETSEWLAISDRLKRASAT